MPSLTTASAITLSPLRAAEAAGARPAPTVVTLTGEHDICTVQALTDALDVAIERDGAGLAVDLSQVEFMGAATLGVLIHARELLRSHGRSLVLRDPSACALQVIELCGLDRLLEHPPDAANGWAPRRRGR